MIALTVERHLYFQVVVVGVGLAYRREPTVVS
jgi:hypothetical protein